MKPDVLILCGGLGTRLRQTLPDLPKPMADIAGRPFLEILLRFFTDRGYLRLILCVGHQAEKIKSYFHEFSAGEILYSEETAPLGTAGALRAAASLSTGDVFLVSNGDSYCPVDPDELHRFHVRKKSLATLTAAADSERTDGGSVEIGADGQVLAFREKTPAAALNAGVYAFNRAVLERIPPKAACSLEHEVLPGLVGKGLHAFMTEEKLHDIGTPERLDAFRRFYASHPNETRHPG